MFRFGLPIFILLSGLSQGIQGCEYSQKMLFCRCNKGVECPENMIPSTPCLRGGESIGMFCCPITFHMLCQQRQQQQQLQQMANNAARHQTTGSWNSNTQPYEPPTSANPISLYTRILAMMLKQRYQSLFALGTQSPPATRGYTNQSSGSGGGMYDVTTPMTTDPTVYVVTTPLSTSKRDPNRQKSSRKVRVGFVKTIKQTGKNKALKGQMVVKSVSTHASSSTTA